MSDKLSCDKPIIHSNERHEIEYKKLNLMVCLLFLYTELGEHYKFVSLYILFLFYAHPPILIYNILENIQFH